MVDYNSMSDEEKAIEQFRLKRMIKNLQSAAGAGTSMITLIIPAGQGPLMSKLLTEESGKASNIKSRVNRQSVQSAITAAQHKLKTIGRIPDNGVILFSGTAVIDGKEKKISYAYSPFKPLKSKLYRCDSRFHTEPLEDLLETSRKFGFIIVDGKGALYGTVSGNERRVLQKFSVDLPKKHRKGGQSSVRFARLRVEARHNYVRKVAELATTNFIENDMPNVEGLILAGSADFKTVLNDSQLFDPRLQGKVISVVDISYGDEAGFNQAIQLSQGVMADVQLVHEKKLLDEYFSQIAQDTGVYCYGLNETLSCLESGAVETLLVYENLDYYRLTFVTGAGDDIVIYLTNDQIQKAEYDVGNAELVEQVSWVEWMVEEYKKFGCKLEIISDKTQEGAQFINGFGGVGAMLRWKIDPTTLDGDLNAEDLSDLEDFM